MPTTTNMTLTGGLTLGTALTAANGGTGITSLGTGVATALGIATNNASGGLATETDSTFTPDILFGGANVGLTYTGRSGIYTRVGNTVTFQLYINISAVGSSTGNATISGMPVAGRTATAQISCFSVLSNSVTFTGSLQAYINQGTSVLTLVSSSSGSALANITNTAFTTGSYIYITGTYLV